MRRLWLYRRIIRVFDLPQPIKKYLKESEWEMEGFPIYPILSFFSINTKFPFSSSFSSLFVPISFLWWKQSSRLHINKISKIKPYSTIEFSYDQFKVNNLKRIKHFSPMGLRNMKPVRGWNFRGSNFLFSIIGYWSSLSPLLVLTALLD